MPKFEVFHARNFQKVADISADLVKLDYNEAPYGSLEGTAIIEILPDNQSLLDSFDEFSHFVRVSPDDGPPAGAVIKAAYSDKGVCNVSIIGFLEYLENIPFIAAHKATSIGSSTVIPAEDPSWNKQFMADSNLGLFFEIFTNLELTMRAQGFSPFFRMVGIIDLIESSQSEEFNKRYRLNTLETPNLADVYTDLTEDEDFLPVRVSVSSGDTFSWILSGMTSYDLIEIDESTDRVFNVEIERGDRIQRAMALAAGTDPKSNNLISKIDFSSTAAYSAVFAESASKSTLDIARTNRAKIAGANKKLDQITFSSWDSGIEIFNAISIYGEYLPRMLAVITEKAIDGQVVTYTGTVVTTVDEMIPNIKKPTSDYKRAFIEPAKVANRRSIRQGLEKDSTTGWK